MYEVTLSRNKQKIPVRLSKLPTLIQWVESACKVEDDLLNIVGSPGAKHPLTSNKKHGMYGCLYANFTMCSNIEDDQRKMQIESRNYLL